MKKKTNKSLFRKYFLWLITSIITIILSIYIDNCLLSSIGGGSFGLFIVIFSFAAIRGDFDD